MFGEVIEINQYDTSWEIACKFINAKYKYTNMLGVEVATPMFDNDTLRRIGEHLINYARVEETGNG